MNRVESPVVKRHEGTYEERELEGKQLVRQDPAAFLELDSPNRRNRAKIHIANDEAAIDAYLEEYKDSPNTKRAYKKELRRFLLWSRVYAHARFEDLMRDDLRSYERWMRSPPGHLIGDARVPYGTEGWRPFRSALSNDAIQPGGFGVGAISRDGCLPGSGSQSHRENCRCSRRVDGA